MAGGDMLTGHTRLPEPNQNANEDCRRRWTRTIGPQIKNLLLCQLSYTTLKARTMNRTGSYINHIGLILIHT